MAAPERVSEPSEDGTTADRGPVRRRSLAVRTMAGVVAVVALALVLLTMTTLGIAGRVVTSQLEQNVTESWRRTSGFIGEPGPNERMPDNDLGRPSESESTQEGSEDPSVAADGAAFNDSKDPINAPGLPVGTVILLLAEDGSASYTGEIDSSGQRTTLTDQDAEDLRHAVTDHEQDSSSATSLFHVTLSSGEFLVQSGQLENGETFVLGITTADVDHTRSQLLVAQVAGSCAALLFVGVGVWWWIRRSLRPLRQVSKAAARVSEVPMSSGSVELERYRVADDLAQPRDEVGDVGYALNELIDSVNSALADRAASEEKLRAFIADASHELRTPLASVRGYAEMLQLTEPLQENGQKMLRRVLEQSERMSSLVESLLLLARLDAAEEAKASTAGEVGEVGEVGDVGSSPDAPRGSRIESAERPSERSAARRFDLGELVIDAVMDATAAGRDHVWDAEIPDDPVLVRGDSSQISQLLANLLSNARKHTPAGTEVNVNLQVQGSMAVFTVIDDGPGIAPALIGKLFDRFVRGDSVRTGTEGSTGLGLSIVRSVARAHGGEATVQSREGHTEFRVRLPLASESSEAVGRGGASTSSSRSSTHTTRPREG